MNKFTEKKKAKGQCPVQSVDEFNFPNRHCQGVFSLLLYATTSTKHQRFSFRAGTYCPTFFYSIVQCRGVSSFEQRVCMHACDRVKRCREEFVVTYTNIQSRINFLLFYYALLLLNVVMHIRTLVSQFTFHIFLCFCYFVSFCFSQL